MKTQTVIVRIAIFCALPVLAFLLSQCACCPPLSGIGKPSFTGCWLTEYSQQSSADTSIKGDLHFKELAVSMKENDDSTVIGYWVGLLSNTPGKLTGKVNGVKLNGVTFIGSGTAPQDSLIFTLSESGLTFTGKYGSTTPSRRFYWNDTKVSNCKCSESIYTTLGSGTAYKK